VGEIGIIRLCTVIGVNEVEGDIRAATEVEGDIPAATTDSATVQV